jgi:DinB superfamily
VTEHEDRVTRLSSAWAEASGRFIARIESAGEAAADASPAGGWNAARIAWHVATVNDRFAKIIGEGLGAAPASEFVERDWRDIVAGMPSRREAPAWARPPDVVDPADALRRLRQSSADVSAAIAALTPERGAMCVDTDFTESISATISVYQAAEWAAAHVILHNRQAKRALGEG